MFKFDGFHTNVFGEYPIMQYDGTYTVEYEQNEKIVTGKLNELIVDTVPIASLWDGPLAIYITRNIDKPSLVSIIYCNEEADKLIKWTPTFEDIFDPLITGDELLNRKIHVKIIEEMAKNIKSNVDIKLTDIVYGMGTGSIIDYIDDTDWMVKRNFTYDSIYSTTPIMELYCCLKEIMKSEQIKFKYGKGASMVSDAFKDYGLTSYDEWVKTYGLLNKRDPNYIVRKKAFLDKLIPF